MTAKKTNTQEKSKRGRPSSKDKVDKAKELILAEESATEEIEEVISEEPVIEEPEIETPSLVETEELEIVEEIETPEIEESIDESTVEDTEEQLQLCRVIEIRNGKVSFDFNGVKLSLKAKKDLFKTKKNGFVKVEYEGEIGTKEFKVLGIK